MRLVVLRIIGGTVKAYCASGFGHQLNSMCKVHLLSVVCLLYDGFKTKLICNRMIQEYMKIAVI